jgi:membrane glycosyltransferase
MMGMDYSVEGAEWKMAAKRRRRWLLALVVLPALLAARFLTEMLPNQGSTGLEIAIITLFAILFAWVSSGFWTSVMGFVTLIRRVDRFSISRTAAATHEDEAAPLSKTAIIMPICNEDVSRVFKGLEVIYRSLEKTGQLESFDFFILSDSSDPDIWVEEEMAWAELCRKVGGFERIFYRMRRSSIKRKSGNVADFCRRWGKNYVYMIVLDADSIMAGNTLVRLVRMMDNNPRVGLIQTLPAAVNRESLYARMQQFANRVYGPIFAAGLHFWQLGEAHYWGHNAIIRIAPFMDHCGLPRLPGRGPLSGEIMSHDFVEAALMRRAGWSVWLAYDLKGSYEETATTLPDDLKRDRRWSHGNLQHLKLLFADRIHSVHRGLFINGIMAYVTSPLWFLLLLLSSIVAIEQASTPLVYFSHLPSLFPQWPVSYKLWALGLFVFTMCLLFLPKTLALLLAFRDRHFVKASGGRRKLVFSVLVESVVSMFIAPIRMAVHTRFIVLTLLGRRSRWGAQQREDYELGWREALACHGLDTLIGITWGVTLYVLAPGFLLWLIPVLTGFVLSVPVALLTSRKAYGLRLRRWGLLLTPEEIQPPAELKLLTASQPAAIQGGVMRAVVDPFANALHIWLLKRESGLARRPWVDRDQLVRKFLEKGVSSLTNLEKHAILSDARAMAQLHRSLWEVGKEPSHISQQYT